jgi:CMP/dCMP kinase
MKAQLIVTIDGPSGAGKSTAARVLAEKLGYTYLDSGAMYRAFAYRFHMCRQKNASLELESMLKGFSVRFLQGCLEQRIYVDLEDVSEEIRKPYVSMLASDLSTLKHVRDRMTELQREIGCQGGIIAEGRDMGTVVFPHAHMKFFLTADLNERALRRHQERFLKGDTATLQQVRDDMKCRDFQDRSRELAPLKPAGDAVTIDSSHLTVDEVVDVMLGLVHKKMSELIDRENDYEGM